jgi:uncharacterized protein involved in exopolysaccharide biosynthesis
MIATIIDRIWWVIASVVLFTAAFIAAAYLITPIYRATIILIPTKTNRDMDAGGSGLGAGIGGVASLVGINLGGGDSLTEEALAVLKSRKFTESFISDLNLMPVLYAKSWDAQTGKWKPDVKHPPTLSRANKFFGKAIRSILPEKKSSLISVSIDWTDPVVAASWANELIRRLNLEMRQREMTRADASIGYLEHEFETTTVVATREAIGRLIESQVKQRMLATVTPEFAFRVIDPAMPSDKDDRYSPNKFLLAVMGPIVGTIFGVFGVLTLAALRTLPRRGR